MLKKVLLSGILLVFIFLTSGCGTLYKGASGLAQGVKEGAWEDWSCLKNADAWFKKNLW